MLAPTAPASSNLEINSPGATPYPDSTSALTGISKAAVIRPTTRRYSVKSMFSPSALPMASATGWLPTVSPANPASAATRALHVSQTVGRTTRSPDS